MQTDHKVYRGMLWSVFCVTALAVLLAAPGAYAADNSACMTCHSVITNFTVTPVDRDSACAKCHIPGIVGSLPYHQPGSHCGSVCHPGWGDSLMTAVPSYYDSAAGASFASATSKATSPALLHVIHANPRWPGSMDRPASACSSCHAAASCSACHEDAIDPVHATHGSSTYPQWSGRVGHGVVGADQTVKTAGNETNQCATPACHDLEGTRSLSVRLHEDYSHAVGQNTFDPTVANTVTTTGTWLTRFNSQRTAGRFMFSATAGATHSLTFTGTRVELISDKDPYRGRAEVFIDNVSQGIIDCYAPSTTAQAVVFIADDLAPGEHTIRVRVLGQKQAASRAAYVVVDAYRVFDNLPDSIAPECLSCHADKGEGHGGDFDHVATNVTGIYPGPAPDYSCTACHSLNMFTEHSRTSSASKAAGCSACHTTYAAFALNTYDGTCAWSECHQAANGHEPHVAASTLHIAADVETQACRDCHGSDLAVVHENAPNRCLTCHGPTLYPTTTSCIDAVCHATSGVVSIETHPAPAHDASGTDAGVARTGGYACSTCHVLELVDEHTKPSSRGTGDTDIDCASCHSASYYPAGWNDGAPVTNTCVSCHNPAGAAVPHTAAGYGVAHDYSANASSCGSGAGAYCHSGVNTLLGDIASADALHAASKPGGADCTSCHATNTSVPS
ncbi:MAG: hypothetical protein Q8M66_07040, partial [Actinomycetota bacterium]|nr:hypothetical protein [Actinomycetota bacterium]